MPVRQFAREVKLSELTDEQAQEMIDRGVAAAGTLHGQKLNERLEREIEDRLRDEFAKATLTGMTVHHGWGDPENLAKRAYVIADALIAERRKRQKEGQ